MMRLFILNVLSLLGLAVAFTFAIKRKIHRAYPVFFLFITADLVIGGAGSAFFWTAFFLDQFLLAPDSDRFNRFFHVYRNIYWWSKLLIFAPLTFAAICEIMYR